MSSLCSRAPESAVVFHIPHASTEIPPDLADSFLLTAADLRAEVVRLTDHYTDRLVESVLPAAVRARFPVSRLVVDPERFAQDTAEPMSLIGMGAVYQRTSDGRRLRRATSPVEREQLMQRFYVPHHQALAEAVDRALAMHDRCLLIDVHSFPSKPLPYEIDQDPHRPDICLGTDEYHTTKALAAGARGAFQALGFSVELNRPFAGALVPMGHYRRDHRVSALMIEVNRQLYLDEDTAERLGAFDEVRRSLGAAIEATFQSWWLVS